MAELGELVLWAALPVLGLALFGSLVGAGVARSELATVGRRAAFASSCLVFVALAGLAHALINVRLKYAVVAGYAGFQEAWPSRLAAMWVSPAGAALLVLWLLITAAAVSSRLGTSRRVALRTGLLSALAIVALLVVGRARPFAQPDLPLLMGAGLPLVARDPAWQVEAWASYLAIACAAFAFAGVAATRLAESLATQRSERVAVRLTAGLLVVAAAAAAWRAYGNSGRLLDVAGVGAVAVHLPAWFVAIGYLHAPEGAPSAGWSDRWQRIMGLALFPAVLGAGAAHLADLNAATSATLWVGGLAAGVISGAAAGLAGRRLAGGSLDDLPGFGPLALLGCLIALALAGLIAIWGLLGSQSLLRAIGLLVIGSLVAMTVWSARRPAGTWRRPWVVALAAAGLSLLAGHALLDGVRRPALVLAGGLVAAVIVGLVADSVRVLRARSRWEGYLPSGFAGGGTVIRWRTSRRVASIVGHLGCALIVLGTAGAELSEVRTLPLRPGQSVELAGTLGRTARVTYLGLSRYEVGALDKRVASFRFSSGKGEAGTGDLITATLQGDRGTGRQLNRPALLRGALEDVVVGIAGLSDRDGEGIICRCGTRPLASLVWLGASLVLLAVLVRRSWAL